MQERIDTEWLGMTFAEYAAARDASPHAARTDYARLMRDGAGVMPPAVTRCQHDDGVLKFCLPAGPVSGIPMEIESVIIPMHSYRGTTWYTLCLSSQVGCRMACSFCETGRMGLVRNLTAGEIVRQRLAAEQLLRQRADVRAQPGIRNLVFMGMGEPLDNLDAVVQAIRIFNEPNGLNIPHTRITVSTVGRTDGLRKLAALNWPNLRLAISLNAANDGLRVALMPVNRGMPLADLQRALIDYPLGRRGRFLIEYVLIKDVNDSPDHADEVAAWCRPLRCTVNLIPYNLQRDAAYGTPSDATVTRFLFRLRAQGLFAKRRVAQGRDLMSACGQLGNPAVREARRLNESPPAATRSTANSFYARREQIAECDNPRGGSGR